MLSSRRAVILVSFAVELRRAFGETGRAVRSHRHLVEALHPLLVGDGAHPFAASFAKIEGADTGYRLYAHSVAALHKA